MTQTVREVERKLRVHALFRLPPLAQDEWGVASIEAQPTFTMRNSYFDTADLRLFRWGITLRCREGGPDAGWHMKLPVDGADGTTRDEVRVPLGSASVPTELSYLVKALTRDEPLEKIVTLRTERTPYLLRDAEGRATAELVDDTVAILDGERIAGLFREIEVEAHPDAEGEIDTTVMNDVVDALITAGAVPSSISKAASALGPRTQEPADVPEPTWPGPHDPAADAVHAFLALHVRRLLLQDVRLRRGLPDAVHQLRVAARRLRSGLQAFRPLIDREWADSLRAELAWAAGSLGLARDTEVLLERLDMHTTYLDEDDAALARSVLDPALQGRVEGGEQEARSTLESSRYLALLVALVEAVSDPPLTEAATRSCRDALPPLVRKAWRKLAKDVHALDVDTPSPQWHETRIAAKKARYAVEAVTPIFGHTVKDFADQLSRVTDILGTHQDAHVAQTTLRSLVPGADGRQGYALGLLHGIEVNAEMADRRAFFKAWPHVRRAARGSGLV